MRIPALAALLLSTALSGWSQIGVNTGDLKIEPKYLGQTLDQINAAFEIGVYIDGTYRGLITRHYYNNQPAQPSLTLAGLEEGSHSVSFYAYGIGFFAAHNATVTQGSLSTDAFELSGVMGVIKGNLNINGAPPSVDNLFAVCGASVSNSARYLAGGSSAFRILVLAGSRNGTIFRTGTGVIKLFAYTALAGQEVIVGDPFQLNLVGTLTGKSGPFNARIWQYTLKNLDSGAVSPTVSAFSLTQTFGTTCTPVLSTTLPVQYPLLVQNASSAASFTLDLSSCAANVRFTLNVTAASGATTQSFSHVLQFR